MVQRLCLKASAFESYEKEQSYNAPVGKYAMFAYTTALNYLLTQSKYVKLLGDTTVVYWSEDADIECKDLFLAASEPTTDNQELLDGVFSNLEKGYAVDVDSVYKNINLNQRFYILGIAPNAARLSVRFFYTDEFGKILQHLKWSIMSEWKLYGQQKIPFTIWEFGVCCRKP